MYDGGYSRFFHFGSESCRVTLKTIGPNQMRSLSAIPTQLLILRCAGDGHALEAPRC